MNQKFNPTVIIVGLLLIGIILFIDPSGKLLDTIASYAKIGIGGVIGLVLLAIVILGLLTLVSGLFRASAEKKRPNFFEEMQSALRSILLPLGFEEREGSGRSRYAEYSRDEFSVWLTLDIMDSIYYVTASQNPEVADNQKTSEPDFTIECVDLRKADEFKSESIAKLNEWLIKKRVR